MMQIVISTDNKYIMPTGVMMKSLSLNNEDTMICFHILVDETVTDNDRDSLRRVLIMNENHTIRFHEIGEYVFDDFPRLGEVKDYITKATYYRLFITRILSDDIDKVLYLDGDIIVHQPLDNLWNIDITGYAIGSVTDAAEKIQDYDRLGYAPEYGYFNAGVLLINLKYWRDQDMLSEFIDIIKHHSDRIRLHDQDVLNIVFHKNKKTLPVKYNLQDRFLYKEEYLQVDRARYHQEIEEAISNPVIVHYTDSYKPWHKNSKNPYIFLFLNRLAMTEWADYKRKNKYTYNRYTYMVGSLLRRLSVLPKLRRETVYRDFN